MAAKVIYLFREKVLFDTSIYINHLNRGLHAEAIRQAARSSILYLHSTVFEELLAGTRTVSERKTLSKLKKRFRAANRIVTPTDADWEETGILVNKIVHQGMPPSRVVGLTHDILISLSARREGIRVITENRVDFERIKALRDFKLTVWSP